MKTWLEHHWIPLGFPHPNIQHLQPLCLETSKPDFSIHLYSVPMTTKNVDFLSYKTSYRQSVDYFMVITVGNNGSVVIVGYLKSLTGIFPGCKCRYSRLSQRLCYSQQKRNLMRMPWKSLVWESAISLRLGCGYILTADSLQPLVDLDYCFLNSSLVCCTGLPVYVLVWPF